MISPFSLYSMNVAGAYLNIYPFTAILFIIIYLFLKQERGNEIINWLYVFNTIVLWITPINLILYAAELFIAWYGQNTYEYYVFTENKSNVFSHYGWSYWLMIGCNFLLPQLFWFRRLRKSTWFTFFIAFFLGAGIWFERIVIYVTSMYRDYLPSSWSTYYDGNGFLLQMLLNLGCFVILSLLVYWILNKRKRLPFPSTILS